MFIKSICLQQRLAASQHFVSVGTNRIAESQTLFFQRNYIFFSGKLNLNCLTGSKPETLIHHLLIFAHKIKND